LINKGVERGGGGGWGRSVVAANYDANRVTAKTRASGRG
jgi:hypothetical protein